MIEAPTYFLWGAHDPVLRFEFADRLAEYFRTFELERAEAGQLLVIQPTNPVSHPLPEQVAPDVMRDTLAWQDSRLKFSNTPLVEAVAEFNKRNRVQIELADAELAQIPIGGGWNGQNVEAFVRMLTVGPESTIVVEAQSDPNRIVLRRAP